MSTDIPAPSDAALATGFALDLDVDPTAMQQQAVEIVSTPTPGSSVRTTRSQSVAPIGVDPHADIQRKQPLLAPAPAVRGQVASRGRGGLKGKGKAQPVRENQLQRLTTTLSSIESDNRTPVPEDDLMRSADYDQVSARSSKIEEVVDNHSNMLVSTQARILALETENSLLVSRINALIADMAAIKERLGDKKRSGEQSDYQAVPASASSFIVAPPAHSGSPESSKKSGLMPPPMGPVGDKARPVVGKPIHKRKFLE